MHVSTSKRNSKDRRAQHTSVGVYWAVPVEFMTLTLSRSLSICQIVRRQNADWY